MTIADGGSALSEAVRERETFKYDSLEISTAALLDPETAKPIPSAVLSSTPDPGLTAFAQLGLYRLDGSRALVSLFDRKNQHIVAEAVRATPLNLDQDHLEQLWLCGTAVPRATSICEHVLAGPAASLTIPGNDTGNAPSDLPVSVVLDLDQDERFCEVKDTQKRFYIGVPIRSPAGINIGVYCVFDDKPRQQISPAEIQFIRDMSRTVMDFLEAKRSHECYRREERMVRGLGSFVEGKATLSNWSQSSNPSSFQDLPGVQEGILNKKLRGANGRATKPATTGPRVRKATRPASPVVNGVAASRGDQMPPQRKVTPGRRARLSPAGVPQEDVQSVFSKAANIIRESIEVEGVLYLDASISSFGGLIGQELSSPPVLGKPSSDESSSDEVPSSHFGDAAGDKCCRVLGHSTSQSSSVNGDGAVSPLTDFPEKFLHWLLQRYPHGKIYNMEVDVTPLSHAGVSDLSLSSPRPGTELDAKTGRHVDSTTKKSEKGKPRQSIASFLARLFPGARSVAFVPLWDSQRNRWFAGSFVWTRTPTRIFTPENELSYLKVYGLTIMAEVTRLHIMAADKTKLDVLGSISHELRSPLHGVVGAAELLRQTNLDSSQEKILRTIQISSRTLLDTIDHLLDYGKMNGLIKSARLETSSSTSRLHNSDSTSAAPESPGVPIQLDRLVEEVVESVLAGYGYMNMSEHIHGTWNTGDSNSGAYWQHPSINRSATERPPRQEDHAGPEAVQIYLDIEPSESWSFRMQPGAFRRIVMNLFGNSLKFTKAGFIRVHVTQDPPIDQVDTEFPRSRKILLTVSDSGKGISEEYLRNQLYTPFAQEDHFAPGTGLGLSLVREVVTTLGGAIHVASQIGRGTAVTVSLPLQVCEEIDEEEASFRAVLPELAGLRVLLRGHEGSTPVEAAHSVDGVGERHQHRQTQLQLAGSICRAWLGMQIVSRVETQDSPPDFIIATDESFVGGDSDATPDTADCPHILVCPSSTVAQAMTSGRRMPASFELISQPLGPRKLAKSLFDSRQRWRDAQRPGAESPAPPHLAILKPLVIDTPSPSHAVGVTAVLKVAGIIDERTDLPDSDFGQYPVKPRAESPGGSDVVLDCAAPISAQPQPGLPMRSSARRRSVMVVDDNLINRKILAAYMKKIGQPYCLAENGLEALEKYIQSPSAYSCVLTDISMPVMDGLESSRRLREFERARQLSPCKIIAITSLSGLNVQQDAFASGVNVLLTRPALLNDVVNALEALGLEVDAGVSEQSR